ncbi:hypothetical protein [Zavarzinella formosa]|uniref:hypothetical protein n=1 Tax=Zavarzinella formosa TaxID=360055 RepID=UPI0002FE6D14|nr:hypothetical protein [Zavarzinella formosa]
MNFQTSAVLLTAFAFAAISRADDQPPNRLAEHVIQAEAALAALGQPLSKESSKALRSGDTEAIHDALGDLTLFVVSINPEGRVKLARGPAVATFVRGEARHMLVKVVNQSGAQQRLTVRGAYAGSPENPFTLAFASHGKITPDLTGQPVEYRIMAITASATGKHELSVTIEAGQGTQELGFRGESPVLFTVRERMK